MYLQLGVTVRWPPGLVTARQELGFGTGLGQQGTLRPGCPTVGILDAVGCRGRWCVGVPPAPRAFPAAMGCDVCYSPCQQIRLRRFVSDAKLLLHVHLFNAKKPHLTDNVFLGL